MKQNKCIVVGLTGGISTGKSTVTNIIIEDGFKVIDADKIAREVVEIGKPAYEDIVRVFGEEILDKNLNIDRKKLGSIIFSNKEYRMKLNAIVHPRVFQTMREKLKDYSIENAVVFLDIPLLIEEMDIINGYGINFDEIWVVYTKEKIQIERLMDRDNISYQDAYKKIKSQMPIEQKIEYANRIIDNNNGLNELAVQVKKLLNFFK